MEIFQSIKWVPREFWILTGIAIVILSLTVLRKLTLWYYGISEIHRNQEEIIELLEIIASQSQTKTP